MINGLGVLGWGVGGIEAEAAMVGQPIFMLVPEVVGFRLTGGLPEGTTATDLVLRITQMLRAHGVVGKFVEFFGPGLADMPLANRATIANMAPEYGATVGYFPVDQQTTRYLRLTGRDEALVETVEQYCNLQGLWRDDSHDITYSSTLELDMGTVEPSLAGPKRPQDRIDLGAMQQTWRANLDTTFADRSDDPIAVSGADGDFELSTGDVVIAAITSCTNTSNPDVMVGAGLVARKARDKGLNRKPWVKTSFAPGSKVVTEYLGAAGLTADLEALGFYLVGYGCTTCIGNSGPLPAEISAAVHDGNVVAASVLSGNRNFEGRISPDVQANFLASPPLVVAYAIAGTVDIDLTTDPIGTDSDGNHVLLRDIWPTQEEISEIVATTVTSDQFKRQYGAVFEGADEWKAIEISGGDLFAWDETSTYIQEPPFFADLGRAPAPITPVAGARALLKLGDSVTTDHISPAGAIGPDTPAGQFLTDRQIDRSMFNSYGSRRGKDYGMGSSRDWAAKGAYLLGVRAVITDSFERIHRSNLVMMGVLPLTFLPGTDASTYDIDGTETYDIAVDDDLTPRQEIKVRATRTDGEVVEFSTVARVDTPVEVEYLRHGGILHMVLRRMAADH
jgi:aconitate hydratase